MTQADVGGNNLKLGDVATNILGKSGWAILEALLAGPSLPICSASILKRTPYQFETIETMDSR